MAAGSVSPVGARGRSRRRFAVVASPDVRGTEPIGSARRPRPRPTSLWAGATGDALVVFLIVTATDVSALEQDWARSALAGGIAAAGFTVVLTLMRGHRARWLDASAQEYLLTARACGMWAVLVLIGGPFSEAVVPGDWRLGLAMVVLATSFVILSQALRSVMIGRRRARGVGMARILLVGEADHLRRLNDLFESDPGFGFQVSGVCLAGHAEAWSGAPVLGGVDGVREVLDDVDIHVVIVSAACMEAADLRRLCWRVESRGIDVLVAPDVSDVSGARTRLHSYAGVPLVEISRGSGGVQRLIKSGLDRALALVLLAVLSPVLVVSVFIIKTNSPGPAFFHQRRIGRGGVEFEMLKLRTMHLDADARRDELLEKNDGNVVLFKLRHDPRVTPVGRVLRRFSIDELPQLWNVVRGDMSLVGPRPPLAHEAALYGDDVRQRLRVKPGMTGLWQVSGRSDLNWEETSRLDLYYADNWSIAGDVGILMRTFRAVFGGRGAY